MLRDSAEKYNLAVGNYRRTKEAGAQVVREEEAIDTVKKLSIENLDKLKHDIISSNIIVIGEENEKRVILNLAIQEMDKEGIKPKETSNIEDFAKRVKNYQTRHSIDVDGKIGKETYMEMKVGIALGKINIVSGINKQQANNVISIMREAKNLFGKDKFGQTFNTIGLSGIIGAYLEVDNYKEVRESNPDATKILQDFFATNIEPTVQAIQNNPKAQADAQKAMATKNASGGTTGGDLVEVFKGNMEWGEFFQRNKGGIAVAAILGFVFFGGKMFDGKLGTGTWYGRVGWLFLGGMLGGGELISYGMEQAGKGLSAGREYISEFRNSDTYVDSKKKTLNFFRNLPETIKGINFSGLGDTWESVKSTISDQYETITSATFSYNDKLEGKDGYIEPKLLGELTSAVFGDEKFMNTKKSDLADIKDLAGLKGVLSNPSKLPAGLTKENIASFMKNVQSQFEDDDKFVKDIFITTSIKTTIDSVFADRQYFEDNKLNNEIKGSISNFTSSPNEDKKNAGEVLKRAILSGDNAELQKFDANIFSGLSEDDKKILEGIKKRVLNLRAGQEYLKSEIAKVEALKVVEETNKDEETQDSIVEKIKALETIESEFDEKKLNGIDRTTFETAVYNKKIKLYEKAKELEVSGAENTLSSLEKQKEVQNDLVEVGKLQLKGQVPGNSDSLEDFENYLSENKDVFSEAEKLVKKYKDATVKTPIINNIIIGANGILESKTTYKTKLEAKMKAIKLDVEKLTGELEKIKTTDVEEGEYINRFNALKEVYKKYSDLQTAENIEIANFQNQLNSLFGSTEAPKVELGFTKLKSEIQKKLSELQSSFKIDIDLTGKSYKDASEIVGQIKRKEEIIDSFNNSLNDGLFAKYRDKFSSLFDSNKNQEAKGNEIAEVKEKLVGLYVEAIKGIKEEGQEGLDKIKAIKIDFETNVVDQLDNIDKGLFETAIENKVFGLFKGELGEAKNVGELKDIKNRYGVEETSITVFGYEIRDENKYYKEFLEKAGIVFSYDNINTFNDGTIVFSEYKAFLEKYKGTPYNGSDYLGDYMGTAENMNQFISFLDGLTLQSSLFGKTDEKELTEIKTDIGEVVKKTRLAFKKYMNETLF